MRHLICTVSILSCLGAAAPALAASSVEVTATTLNVRSSPSTQGTRVGQVQRGQVYVSLRRQGDWHELQFDGRRGWSHASYVKASSRALFRVTASSLSVRGGAGTQHPRLGTLPKGTLVAPSASQGEWRRIYFGGRQAWIHGSYLASVAGAASASAALVEVTAATLNARSGPGTQHPRVGTVSRGQVYVSLRASGDWRLIQYGQGTAWVHAGYLRTGRGSVFHVSNASSLNVRSGPSTRYRKLGALARGTSLAVVETSGAWRRLSYAGQRAWVHGSYLAPGVGSGRPPVSQPTRPTSSAGFTRSGNRWGRPALIYGIERVGRRWAQTGRPRMGTGDISYARGGRMSGHASHRRGEDVDVRPTMTYQGAGTIYLSSYRRTWQQHMINLYRAEMRIDLILFNDRNVRGVQSYPNHHNHFHARIH